MLIQLQAFLVLNGRVSMRYRFYIGKGDEATRLVAEMISARFFASAYRDALIEQSGAHNLFFYANEPDRPRGFVYGSQEERQGLKFGAAIKGGFTYFPDSALEEGRKFEELLSDSRLRFDQEVYLLKALNISGEARGYCEHCRNLRALFKPQAFRPDNKFEIFLKIPVGMDPYPEIPGWFREVKESVWLARQGK